MDGLEFVLGALSGGAATFAGQWLWGFRATRVRRGGHEHTYDHMFADGKGYRCGICEEPKWK